MLHIIGFQNDLKKFTTVFADKINKIYIYIFTVHVLSKV